MNFLHTDAQLAADSICDQDAEHLLVECTRALHREFKGTGETTYALGRWLHEDGMNYRWLGLFCEELTNRPGCSSYYQRTKNLRICVPETPSKQLTVFPHDIFSDSKDSTKWPRDASPDEYFARVVASYRTSYIETRWRYAEWSKTGCPGWFFRLANTILPERDRSNFLLRVQPPGPSSADDQGSLWTKRDEVRDGPVGEITGESDSKFVLF